MPKISVIVATYNAEKSVGVMLDCLKLQTFTDFEIVVNDDCSTDNTIQLVKDVYMNPKSEKYDSRVRIYKTFRNVGYGGGNVDHALSLISPDSKYIYLAGGDDAMMEDNIKLLYDAAEKSQADVTCLNSHYYTFDQNFTIPGRVAIEKYRPNMPAPRFLSDNIVERLERDFIGGWLPAVDWLKIYRRDFLENSGIYFPRVLGIDDFFYNFAQICLAKKIFVVEGCGYFYRQNPSSVMHASAEKHLRNTVRCLSDAVAYMNEIFSLKMIGELSKENQLICELYAICYMIQERILRYGISITDMDKILLETTKTGEAIDPEVTRVLIQALTYVLSFHFYKKADRKELFQLVR